MFVGVWYKLNLNMPMDTSTPPPSHLPPPSPKGGLLDKITYHRDVFLDVWYKLNFIHAYGHKPLAKWFVRRDDSS